MFSGYKNALLIPCKVLSTVTDDSKCYYLNGSKIRSLLSGKQILFTSHMQRFLLSYTFSKRSFSWYISFQLSDNLATRYEIESMLSNSRIYRNIHGFMVLAYEVV
jgi:hypothetical protein